MCAVQRVDMELGELVSGDLVTANLSIAVPQYLADKLSVGEPCHSCGCSLPLCSFNRAYITTVTPSLTAVPPWRRREQRLFRACRLS
jgi:hypothetical protein